MQDYRMQTLITVCKHLNFTKAGEELHLAQPTVSLHIHSLEDYYNIKIFEFSGKKMLLTAQGELLLNTAITQQNDEIRLIDKLQQSERAPIRLGATLSLAESILARPLANFITKRAGDYIQIDTDNTANLLNKIDNGSLDAAFVEGEFPTSDFDALHYRTESFVGVYASKSFDIRPNCSAIDLINIPLIMRENGSGTRAILENYLSKNHISVSDFLRAIEIGSIHLIKELVKNGIGISFLYQATVQQELNNGELSIIPLVDGSISHDISFIWRKNSVFAHEYKSIFDDFN